MIKQQEAIVRSDTKASSGQEAAMREGIGQNHVARGIIGRGGGSNAFSLCRLGRMKTQRTRQWAEAAVRTRPKSLV